MEDKGVDVEKKTGSSIRLSEISLQDPKALRDLIPLIGFHRSPGELQHDNQQPSPTFPEKEKVWSLAALPLPLPEVWALIAIQETKSRVLRPPDGALIDLRLAIVTSFV
jgi:hypothetical protein